MKNSNLRALVDAYGTAQKARIQWSNRISALVRGTDNAETPQLLQAREYHDDFSAIEKKAYAAFREELEQVCVWPWLQKQKGIKDTLAAKLVSRIEIEKTPRVSSMWKLAGFDVVNGHAPRKERGKKNTWNAGLKTTCWLIGRSFLLCGSAYRKFYDEAKVKFSTAHPDWTKLHVHNAAMGKMIKIFLSHFWDAWREAEGLPRTAPYVGAILGHATIGREEVGKVGWMEGGSVP